MKESSEHRQALTAIIFSNVGHGFSHMFTVLYATAVLYLPKVFDLPYGELLGLSSLGLVLFGVAALPAGWLGDRWSQIGMMAIFFLGIGVGAIVVGLAVGPERLFIGLTLIGLFGSILVIFVKKISSNQKIFSNQRFFHESESADIKINLSFKKPFTLFSNQ